MRLKKVRVIQFRSVKDSGLFDVDDITCLVGKNEAGKTALLQAIHRLNPLDGSKTFSVTDDYPRSEVTDYEQAVKAGKQSEVHAITTIFELSDAEKKLVEEDFGAGVLKDGKLTLQRGYYENTFISLSIDESVACRHLIKQAELPTSSADPFLKCTTLDALQSALKTAPEDEHTKRLAALVDEIEQEKGFMLSAYQRHLKQRVPKFLYFDEFYQMRGHENIDELKRRLSANQLKPSDHPLLGLVELAGLTLDDLLTAKRTQELKNRLEGAGNKLSKTILKYWSQNRHIQIRFDVRPAKPEDPEGMRSGTNVWAEVYDSKHLATTGVGERSRGFVWFFSFLAWYAQQQSKSQSLILLLDEPGLTLHGTAQGDLLRYIEKELGPNHQVIYTTHSPFMVDPKNLERVRIVQDRGMDQDDLPPEEEGTKVFTDVLRASPGSLFPLQGALGFEVQQTLFVGPYVLVVEGVSDLLFIETMSGLLQRKGQVGLSTKWVIAPVGGIDKVPAFVSLFGAQKTLTVATLVDVQKKDSQTIENLYKQKLLAKSHVLTYAQFIDDVKEADVEDMFGDEFYIQLVNAEYAKDLGSKITKTGLPKGGIRILSRLEKLFQDKPLKGSSAFNHYRPARFFAEHIDTLQAELSEAAVGRFSKAFEALNRLLTDVS